MRILYINHEKNMGGAARSLLGLIKEMNQLGNSCVVLTPYKDGKFVEYCQSNNIKYIYCKFFGVTRKNNGNLLRNFIEYIVILVLAHVYNRFAALKVSRIVKSEQIDIIHTNSSVINIGLFLKRILNKPHIFHFREFVEEDFGWKFVPNKECILKKIYKNTDFLIFISKNLESKYISYFKDKKEAVIYNGVETKSLQVNKEWDLNNHQILMAGRLISGKGQDIAIKAVKVLKEKYNIDDIEIYIVGDGDESYKKFLENMVKQDNLQKNVKFIGYRSDLDEYRKNFQLTIACSEREAFGRVVVEGMMACNLVIASNSGAFPEIIDDEKIGILFQPKDPNDLAKKIYNCYLGLYNCSDIIKNAKIVAKREYSAKSNAENINNIYKKFERY